MLSIHDPLGPSVDGGSGVHEQTTLCPQSEMTPPRTPTGPREDPAQAPQAGLVYYNFMRAFYPFQPGDSMTEPAVVVSLQEGDVVLLHSIHVNGWADGTVLLLGVCGWLPTNYCEPYSPDDCAAHLKALLNLWDLLRNVPVDNDELFENQEFLKRIIEGVRFLLERTGRLQRKSDNLRNDAIRRLRKSLLSQLSTLVKTAKRLQENHNGVAHAHEDINDIVDEMILGAFKVVAKSVHLLDAVEENRRTRAAPSPILKRQQQPPTVPSTHSSTHLRVSQHLNQKYDEVVANFSFLTDLRHWQSLSGPELAVMVRQCITSGGKLLAAVDGVCAHITRGLDLGKTRGALLENIRSLVSVTQSALAISATEGTDLVMPHENVTLLAAAAAACVKIAGECVARTKVAIQRVGDFEMELEEFDLGIDHNLLPP